MTQKGGEREGERNKWIRRRHDKDDQRRERVSERGEKGRLKRHTKENGYERFFFFFFNIFWGD